VNPSRIASYCSIVGPFFWASTSYIWDFREGWFKKSNLSIYLLLKFCNVIWKWNL